MKMSEEFKRDAVSDEIKVDDVEQHRKDYANAPQQLAEDEEIPTEAEEAAVMRKLDRHLLPLIFVLYSLSVLDRSNLGNARLAGMEDDIDLSGNRYNTLSTIFYVAYILFQWMLTGYKIFKPHKWVAFVTFFWGFVAVR